MCGVRLYCQGNCTSKVEYLSSVASATETPPVNVFTPFQVPLKKEKCCLVLATGNEVEESGPGMTRGVILV